MGVIPVVVFTPRVDDRTGLRDGTKPVLVQVVLPQPAIKRLDEGIIGGFARPTKLQLDPVLVGLRVQHFGNKLRSIIHRNALRQAVRRLQRL